MTLRNAYEDDLRASAYATLEFHGTYYLAFRDLPQIISKHAHGSKALDFGCGTGRSTRLLHKLGFEVTGVDISEQMIQKAKEIDPHGDYRLIPPGDFSQFDPQSFDLILSAFPFDNIPTIDEKIHLFRGLCNLLKANGILVNIVSAIEIYVHEWTSFSTKDFPENRFARSGDPVRIIITDVEDQRPVIDFLCSDEDYARVFQEAGLEPVEILKTLATGHEPYKWIHETTISPWRIHVLRPAS